MRGTQLRSPRPACCILCSVYGYAQSSPCCSHGPKTEKFFCHCDPFRPRPFCWDKQTGKPCGRFCTAERGTSLRPLLSFLILYPYCCRKHSFPFTFRSFICIIIFLARLQNWLIWTLQNILTALFSIHTMRWDRTKQSCCVTIETCRVQEGFLLKIGLLKGQEAVKIWWRV